MNHSRQRDLIVNYLSTTKTHPTADEIYQEVQKSDPDISLGTVYRNLKLLTENKMIVKLHMEDGIDHYDSDTSEHCHFYCRNCGRVSDLDINFSDGMKMIMKAAENQSDFTIDGCCFFYHGLCRNCNIKK